MDSLKLELKQCLIEALDLDDLTPDDIGDDVPLFGSDGIGLDSIDALEIGIVLRKQYGLKIAANDESARGHFRSINTLAAFITSQRGASEGGGEVQNNENVTGNEEGKS